MNKKESSWSAISNFFKKVGGTQISSINTISNPDFDSKYLLKDYYIQSSYNSCVGNDIKNDYVDIRPLKNVIKRGARLLDFEIWNIDNEPVVAAGLNSDTKYHFKGTYNHLSISNVFDTINRNAFDGGICPNPNDPLFLLFRIKSKNSNIYVNLANKLSEIFKDRLLKMQGKVLAFQSNALRVLSAKLNPGQNIKIAESISSVNILRFIVY